MQYMRSLFGEFCADADDVEVRCTIAAALYIANFLTAAHHGPRTRSEVLQLALDRLLA